MDTAATFMSRSTPPRPRWHILTRAIALCANVLCVFCRRNHLRTPRSRTQIAVGSTGGVPEPEHRPRSVCCPEPVCAIGVRTFSESEMRGIRPACVKEQLVRNVLGSYSETGISLLAAITNADSDGSHAIEGAELFDVMEAFVPKSLMADE